MARESGVTLTSVSPEGVNPYQDYEKISLRIEAECQYHELGDFSSRVESSVVFMKIDQVRADKLSESLKGSGHLRVSMTIGVFRPTGLLEKIFQ